MVGRLRGVDRLDHYNARLYFLFGNTYIDELCSVEQYYFFFFFLFTVILL